jgi:hypothetical protein
MMRARSILIVLSVSVLMACGGGSMSNGPGPSTITNGPVPSTITNGSTASNTTTVPAVANPTATQSTDSVDFAKFWDENIKTGYSRNGGLTAFSFKDFASVKLSSVVKELSIANGVTTLKIYHMAHGANNGDRVNFSKIESTPHGIPKEIMNGSFELFDVTPEYYSINLKYVAKNILATDFIADATYKYKDCTGYQSVKQLPPDNSVASLKFGIVSAIRVAFTVNTNLIGCSPEKSNFTTYKYFTDGISSSGENVKFAPLGQDIAGGMYSVMDGTFAIPSGTLKSGSSGKITSMTNYADSTRTFKQGKTEVTYSVLPHTAQSVFLQIMSSTFDNGGKILNTTLDIYGKSALTTDPNYNLVQTLVTYNNPNRNEVDIVYSANSMDVKPADLTGIGTLQGTPNGKHNWTFVPIDLTNIKSAKTITIIIKLANGKSAANYDVFATGNPQVNPNGKPVGSLVNAYDALPGSNTTLKYTLDNNFAKTYYLAIEGNWLSATTDTNTYSYGIWID